MPLTEVLSKICSIIRNRELMTMPGIDMVTVDNILAEIENIERFPNAKKLEKFAGIAPVNVSSAGKGKTVCPKRGNRCQQVLICIARRLVNIVYGMLKNHTEYRESERK